MSFTRYFQYTLLLTLVAATSIAAAANPREEREDSSEHAWEFNPQVYVAHRSNPLFGKPGPEDKLDFKIHLSYYGERFFIDDVIGYTWFETDHFMFNTIASPSEDYLLFDQETFDIEDVPALDALERRKVNLNGGVELLFDGVWGELALQIQTDLMSTHTGHIVDMAYAKTFGNDKLEIRPKIGAVWKSDNYVNYFYGISAQEAAAAGLPAYQAKAALDWYFYLETRYQVYPNWNLIAGYYAQLGDDTIVDSPLLVSDRYAESFFGIEWVKPFSVDF